MTEATLNIHKIGEVLANIMYPSVFICAPVGPERRTEPLSAPGCSCQPRLAARVGPHPTDTHRTSPQGASPVSIRTQRQK